MSDETKPTDLKVMTHYKQYELFRPISTSKEMQQVYECVGEYTGECCPKSVDSHGRCIIRVKDANDKMEYKFRQFSRAALLKANGDYDKEREKNAPCWRWFDENHKPYSIH